MARQQKSPSADDSNVSIDKKLIQEGTQQLNSEIQVLEAWLKELDASDGNDAEIIAARKSYKDMLRSRKEMLTSLTKQAKQQSLHAN
jgi:cell division septum initiation protein DivIVA